MSRCHTQLVHTQRADTQNCCKTSEGTSVTGTGSGVLIMDVAGTSRLVPRDQQNKLCEIDSTRLVMIKLLQKMPSEGLLEVDTASLCTSK